MVQGSGTCYPFPLSHTGDPPGRFPLCTGTLSYITLAHAYLLFGLFPLKSAVLQEVPLALLACYFLPSIKILHPKQQTLFCVLISLLGGVYKPILLSWANTNCDLVGKAPDWESKGFLLCIIHVIMGKSLPLQGPEFLHL